MPDLPQNRGLVNTFTGQLASPEQSHGMLNFREISERASLNITFLVNHLGVQSSIGKNHVKSIT